MEHRALKRQLYREHYHAELEAPAVKTCGNCLFFDRYKGMNWCVWHDREADERPWVPLCGGALWMEKPEIMHLPVEERNAFALQKEKPSGVAPEGMF